MSEVREEAVEALMPAEGHKHAWKMVAHMDGCHFYASTYTCKCGATASTYDERDVKSDGWSAVWMDDEGRGEPCARCEELMNGAQPEHRKPEITEAA